MQRRTAEEIRNFPSTMRHPSPFAAPLVALALAAVIIGGASYANHMRSNVYDVISREYRVNEFEHLIRHTTLRDSLEEAAWEYTVIAPTDQAFDKAQWHATTLAQGIRTAPNAETGYYDISAFDFVISSPIRPADITFGNHIRVASLSGQEVVFSRVGDGEDGLRINGIPVRLVHTARNGFVYLVDDMVPFPDTEHQLTRNQPEQRPDTALR